MLTHVYFVIMFYVDMGMKLSNSRGRRQLQFAFFSDDGFMLSDYY